MEEFDSSGNHIHLTAENAQETITLAIEHLLHTTALEERTKAFDENTAYLRTQIMKIHEFGGPPRVQLSKILTMFNIEVMEE
ncbi:hypothetical protein ASD24_24265 [Paenibacillus sp. Root52]|uniref:hypothetical protein n=1 Tax=Paenibacillus sp. Root52 TaxID=1736552 RepID=UPI0006FA1076|nr:hypothetical protein [Paenibacillus sp. Root52]KQY90916.1 hypothetical protein ASD24_24265 [Paenibacillus sp. Root52]